MSLQILPSSLEAAQISVCLMLLSLILTVEATSRPRNTTTLSWLKMTSSLNVARAVRAWANEIIHSIVIYLLSMSRMKNHLHNLIQDRQARLIHEARLCRTKNLSLRLWKLSLIQNSLRMIILRIRLHLLHSIQIEELSFKTKETRLWRTKMASL